MTNRDLSDPERGDDEPDAPSTDEDHVQPADLPPPTHRVETNKPQLNMPASGRRLEHRGERARYAYLFHMWAEPRRDGKPPLWRFSLEEVDTGVRHGFGNWDALLRFLQARMVME